MIKNMKSPMQEKIAFKSKYQGKILDHWMDIAKGDSLPHSGDFRPQDFSRHITQVALLKYNESDHQFKDKLVGNNISEKLHLTKGQKSLCQNDNKNVSDTIQNLLKTSRDQAIPLYFEGTIISDPFLPVDFTALALPFQSAMDARAEVASRMKPDTVLLAFEFNRNNSH